MANFVDKLYFDKINAEDRGYRENARIMNAGKEVNRLEDELMQQLSVQNKVVFNQFMEAVTNLSAITDAESFAIGFRQGTQFTYETLNNK